MTNILAFWLPQAEFQNRKKIFNYEFLKVCIINKMYHIPWTLLSDKEQGRKSKDYKIYHLEAPKLTK